MIDVVKPSAIMGKFITALPKGLTPYSSVDEYKYAYDKSGYKMPIDWVIANFWKTADAVAYYQASSNKDSGKTLLTKDMMEGVMKAKELLLANEFTYPYFYNSRVETELMHQLPIYFKYKGFECKALLDGVLIDHKEKTLEPFDLKTTGKSVWEFRDSFLNFGYYRQCAFYEQALLSEESPVKPLLDEGYKLLDYLFIVSETNVKSTRPAVMYRTSKQDRIAGLNGGEINGVKYPGIHSLIEDYSWHTHNNYWEMPRALFLNGGVEDLNIFK